MSKSRSGTHCSDAVWTSSLRAHTGPVCPVPTLSNKNMIHLVKHQTEPVHHVPGSHQFLVGLTFWIMATTSLSFSLQRSFWTHKSSFCSSSLSAGRWSEERTRGSRRQSLYLRDIQVSPEDDGQTRCLMESPSLDSTVLIYLTLATGSWTSSSAGTTKCLLKYFREKISVATSQTSRNLRRFQ